MVGHVTSPGKGCQPHFADPPWCQESLEWQNIDEDLPEEHPARRVVAAVERLDQEPLFASYSAGGSDAVRPDLMLRIVMVEVWSGRYKASQWFKDVQENIALQWAGFGIRPSRTTWYNFRDRLGPLMDRWLGEVLRMAQESGITSAQRGALDGSFVGANASRHRLLNEERLDQRRKELAWTCERDEKGETLGEKIPAWMAKTPNTRINQAERYERAKARLDEFQAINQRQKPGRRRPRGKIVVSATDPDAALGADKQKVFRPLYNVQIISDLDSPLTLAYEVFGQNTDGGTLSPMLQRAHERYGLSLSQLLCDSSYVTGCNLAICERQHVILYGPWQENDFSAPQRKKQKKQPKQRVRLIPKEEFTWVPEGNQYRCPEGHPLTWIGHEKQIQADGEINITHRYRCSPQFCRVCPRRESCTTNPNRGRAVRRSEHEELIEAHRARMATEEAKAIYPLRKQTVELCYADMKENRKLRILSGRGQVRARIEVGLVELVRDLMIIERKPRSHRASKNAGENGYDDTS